LHPIKSGLDIRTNHRWWQVCGLISFFALLLPQALQAAELVVVDQDNCPYCERFENEIAPAWPNTDEGRDVPLRHVNMHDQWPSDLESVSPATLTPTFILIEDGKELGRLVGYAGDEHFWFLIGELLENLEQISDTSSTSIDALKTEPTDP